MSLFSNIFKTKPAGGSSSLFSDKNKFKASEPATVPVPKLPEDKAPPLADAPKKKRRAASLDDSPAAPTAAVGKKPKNVTAAAASAAKLAKPKGAEAREQAEKVAAAARNLGGNQGEDDEKAAIAAAVLNKKGGKKRAEKQAKKKEEKPAAAKESGADEGKTKTKKGANKKKEKAAPAAKKKEEEPEIESDSDDEEVEDAKKLTKKEELAKLGRTIFIGNLPAVAKKKTLVALFSQYGPVESIRLRSVPLKKDVTLPRRAAVASGAVDLTRVPPHAYLVFKEESAARAALAQNMQEWKGHHLRVDMAAAKVNENGQSAQGPEVKYEAMRSVFIGNLHLETQDEELIRFFNTNVGGGGDSQLEAVRIVRDPETLLGKGIGFALFKTKDARRAALGLDGRNLRDRPLRITKIRARAMTGGSSAKKKGERATWQGVTATKSGRSRGPGVKKPRAVIGGKGEKAGGKKREGKRPAVAARKAKQLGLPTPKGVKKKVSLGGKSPLGGKKKAQRSQ